MTAPRLFASLQKTYLEYSTYTMLGDYRVRCGVCSKIIAFTDKQSLDRHLKTSFHFTIAALKPDLKADLKDIKTDTAAIRAAIAKPPTLHSCKVPLVAAEEEKVPLPQQRGEESKKLWFHEIEAIFQGNATGTEYARYNNAFIKWFSSIK